MFESTCEVKDPFWSKGASYQWLNQLKNHPWRRYNQNESLVFVIPANFDAMFHEECKKSEVAKLHQTIIATLEQSDAFQKYQGRDHLFLSTYFKVSLYFKTRRRLSYTLRNVIWAERLDKGHSNCRVSVLHNSPLPRANDDKRNHTLFFIGQADQRTAYRHRVKAISSLTGIGENNVLLGTPCRDGVLPQCNHSDSGCCVPRIELNEFLHLMRESKWNLMIGGDTASSGRFPEAIAMGVPNIIISPDVQHYLSYQCIIPWKNFTILTNPNIFQEHPETTIQEALSKYDSKWEEMKEQQDLYSKHILWSHPKSLAARNTLIESVRKCFPKRVPIEIPSIPCPENFFSKLDSFSGSFFFSVIFF